MRTAQERKKRGTPIHLSAGLEHVLSALRDQNALIGLDKFLQCPIVRAKKCVKILQSSILSVIIGIERILGCNLGKRIAESLCPACSDNRNRDSNGRLKKLLDCLVDVGYGIHCDCWHDLGIDHQLSLV